MLTDGLWLIQTFANYS